MAYDLEFTWNNVHDNLMEELNLSVQDFDRGMTELRVLFNGRVDEIPLKLEGVPETATSAEDPWPRRPSWCDAYLNTVAVGEYPTSMGNDEKKRKEPGNRLF